MITVFIIHFFLSLIFHTMYFFRYLWILYSVFFIIFTLLPCDSSLPTKVCASTSLLTMKVNMYCPDRYCRACDLPLERCWLSHVTLLETIDPSFPQNYSQASSTVIESHVHLSCSWLIPSLVLEPASLGFQLQLESW